MGFLGWAYLNQVSRSFPRREREKTYNLVQSFATWSCFFLLLLYSEAICGTSGSAGFGSVRREDRERITL
jgi:hypothetical protein